MNSNSFRRAGIHFGTLSAVMILIGPVQLTAQPPAERPAESPAFAQLFKVVFGQDVPSDAAPAFTVTESAEPGVWTVHHEASLPWIQGQLTELVRFTEDVPGHLKASPDDPRPVTVLDRSVIAGRMTSENSDQAQYVWGVVQHGMVTEAGDFHVFLPLGYGQEAATAVAEAEALAAHLRMSLAVAHDPTSSGPRLVAALEGFEKSPDLDKSGNTCKICDIKYDNCVQLSSDMFSACTLGCFIPPPIGPVGILACLSLCEVQWIGRNAVCGAKYLTCKATCSHGI